MKPAKKRLPKQENETKLQRVVRYWLNSRAADYKDGWQGAYRDLEYGGCQSGVVGKLIYYTDTVKFYMRHKTEIDALLSDALDNLGSGNPKDIFEDAWDSSDCLANEDHNRTELAWFGFAETARQIAEANGYNG